MKLYQHPDDDEDYRAQDEARFMADDQPDDYEPGICPHCNGSGEGQYDGKTCRFCKGTGETS